MLKIFHIKYIFCIIIYVYFKYFKTDSYNESYNFIVILSHNSVFLFTLQKYIEEYCTTCNKLHCALCQLVNHRTHHLKTISKANEEIRSNLMNNKVELWYG